MMDSVESGGGMPRIGVVGGGLMGSGIAEVCARAGRDVLVVEADAPAAEAAGARIEKSLRRAAERGKIVDPDEVLAQVRFATELDDLADRDLVIEAIVENEEAKVDLFAQLDKIVESRRDPGVQHLLDPDHEAGRRRPSGRSRCSASTSSTRCRCSSWSSWCRA